MISCLRAACSLFCAVTYFNVGSQDDKGWNVIHHMAYNDQSELLGDILRRERKEKPKRLGAREAQQLRESKEPYRKWLAARDNCGYMPIHLAAQFGSNEAFRLLWNASLLRNMNHHPQVRGICRRLARTITKFNRTNDGQFRISLSFPATMFTCELTQKKKKSFGTGHRRR